MRLTSLATTAAVGLMLVVGVDYVAYGATGHSLVLGKSNAADRATSLQRTTAGSALSLKVTAGSPPLAVNSSTRVAKLNADRLDGLDASALVERVTGIVPDACQALAPVTTAYQKIADAGTITVLATTRYTRIDYATTFSANLASASSVAFELRVDDTATTSGRAVYLVKESNDLQYGTITGIFRDLAPGEHTLSLWSRSTGSNATEARLDSGCSSLANNVYVTEFR